MFHFHYDAQLANLQVLNTLLRGKKPIIMILKIYLCIAEGLTCDGKLTLFWSF